MREPWPVLATRLPLRGMSAELARQAEWTGVEGGTIVLTVPAAPMAQGPSVERLRAALIEHFGRPLQLKMQVGETGSDTAHAVAQSEREARQRDAESAIVADPFVQALVQQFGGEIIPGSIKPA
nr:DNA polymerase III subunit gamma/tau C-terminal domain-containing protein [Verticiella sp. GG226]